MTDPGRFAAASAVTLLDQIATADGVTAVRHYAAEIQPGWDIGGNANGGYLMAIAGRAMSEAVGRPPVTLTGHFLRPGPAGTCTVEVVTLRSGRRLATARATLAIDGSPILELLGTFGDQRPDDGERFARSGPPDLAPYDECAPMPLSSDGVGPPLMDRLACRLRPGDDGFRRGEPTGDPTIRGWFSLAGEEPMDAIALLLAADAFPPPMFNTSLPVGWVPTIELTVHIRATPAPGPLACSFVTDFIHDGLLGEDGEIWDSNGVLVAQSRQLALVPRA